MLDTYCYIQKSTIILFSTLAIKIKFLNYIILDFNIEPKRKYELKIKKQSFYMLVKTFWNYMV